MFNRMLRTHLGPVEDECGLAYLRPETAQGIFINFRNVLQTSRKKIPFGIGQIGKSFRNEITPGNFIFRTREFEQMEMEFFVAPGTDEEWHQRWIDERFAWYTDLGIPSANGTKIRTVWDGSSSRSDRRIQPRSSKIMRGTSMAIGFVPAGQHDSSQARSAWNHEEKWPVPAGRLNRFC